MTGIGPVAKPPGLVTSLSLGHKNERRKKENKKKRREGKTLITLVHPIEATFNFSYSQFRATVLLNKSPGGGT